MKLNKDSYTTRKYAKELFENTELDKIIVTNNVLFLSGTFVDQLISDASDNDITIDLSCSKTNVKTCFNVVSKRIEQEKLPPIEWGESGPPLQ
mgnify:CR=1 FL=1